MMASEVEQLKGIIGMRDWLQSAADAECQIFKSPRLGYDVRIKGPSVVGGSLLVEGQPVHAELFAV